MQPTTLRLPDELVNQLEALAEDEGYSSRSEYIRVVLRSHVERETGESEESEERESQADAITDLADRVSELEERLDQDDAREHQAETRRERASTEHDTQPAIEEILADWRPGRNLDKREEQRSAGQAAIEWLKEREVATAAEFKADLEPEHPVTGQSPQTWWKKTAREALKRAADADLVVFVEGRKEWQWQG